MKKFDYDLVVLGAGSGGISATNIGVSLGKRVALVEKRKIGGDCTWFGCVPSKALIKSSQIAHQVEQLKKYGLQLTGTSTVNTDQVMAHVRSVRQKVYQEERPEVFEEKGVNVLIGEPKFLDNNRIKVGDKVISSKAFIISTGSSPFVPSIEGLGEIPYLTNETIFDLDILPKSVVILGGGPIGIEMASALNRLGVDITVLQRREHILPREDPELVEILTQRLEEEGIKILTKTNAVKFSQEGTKIAVTIQRTEKATDQIKSDSILVAVGRTPNVAGLDLEKAGVEYSPKGIVTNGKLQTTAKNIYAIGDVLGGYKFSHVAEYHASIAVPNAILPLPVKRKVNYTNVLWATFTDPEFARAGYTEAEAREKYGHGVLVYRYHYDQVDRAKTDLAQIGMSKFVCTKKGKLLGIHILGERAAELLHEAQLAKTLKVSFAKISTMIHVYPTYGDVVKRPAGHYYADRVQSNVFVRILGKILLKKKR
jgi:pyruvate/2-oxoglutarate dehydrogenase complex dihydrolipoamide dehydrogenase (E3) component